MKFWLIRWATRYYRKVKTWLLVHQPPILAWLFFTFVALLDKRLEGRKIDRQGQLSRLQWKQFYYAYWNDRPESRYRLETDHPVAYSSDDHKHPRGTIFDNSRNNRFNLKLYQWLGYRDDLSLLDLGCAGGGLVKSMLEDGYSAVGLEGSDVSKKSRSGEWDTIPYHLFTCDLTQPFQLFRGDAKALFDIVTSWEVIEHIPGPGIDVMTKNILNHLKPGGYFICSIDLLPDGNPLIGAVYHVNLKSKQEWEEYFQRCGFVQLRDHIFETCDMVRGNGSSLKDWHPGDGGGIHLVLQKPWSNVAKPGV